MLDKIYKKYKDIIGDYTIYISPDMITRLDRILTYLEKRQSRHIIK